MWFSAPPDGSGHGGSETPESNWYSSYKVRPGVSPQTSSGGSGRGSTGSGKGFFARVVQRLIFLCVMLVMLAVAYWYFYG